jgi:hypothetical protein
LAEPVKAPRQVSTKMSIIMLKIRVCCGQWLRAERTEVSP